MTISWWNYVKYPLFAIPTERDGIDAGKALGYSFEMNYRTAQVNEDGG